MKMNSSYSSPFFFFFKLSDIVYLPALFSWAELPFLSVIILITLNLRNALTFKKKKKGNVFWVGKYSWMVQLLTTYCHLKGDNSAQNHTEASCRRSHHHLYFFYIIHFLIAGWEGNLQINDLREWWRIFRRVGCHKLQRFNDDSSACWENLSDNTEVTPDQFSEWSSPTGVTELEGRGRKPLSGRSCFQSRIPDISRGEASRSLCLLTVQWASGI